MPSKLLRGLGFLAYLALLFVIFGLAAYTSFSVFVRSGATTVPTVVGLSRTDAVNLLADHGLVPRDAEGAGRYDDKVPAGRVARQNPDPRTLVKRGSPVTVVLSLGPRRVAVPDLRGKTLPGAQAAISGTGLALGRILGALAPNHEAPGSVLEQDPDTGTAVRAGHRRRPAARHGHAERALRDARPRLPRLRPGAPLLRAARLQVRQRQVRALRRGGRRRHPAPVPAPRPPAEPRRLRLGRGRHRGRSLFRHAGARRQESPDAARPLDPRRRPRRYRGRPRHSASGGARTSCTST